MKKTVTTMLSLALALILVSSLSSGVILAKGDDDHDKRKKNKNKYETVRDVGILSCISAPGFPPVFDSFDDSTTEIALPGEDVVFPTTSPCSVNIAVMLHEKFRMVDVSTFVAGSIVFYSHTFVRTRKEPR